MAFSELEKISRGSKLAAQLADTAPENTPGGKYWYNEIFPWVPFVEPSKIWNEFDKIPGASNQSEADLAVTNNPGILEKITIRLTVDITSNGRAYVARQIFNDNTSNYYSNWILPALVRKNGSASTGYAVRLYHGDPAMGGTELTTTYHSGTGGIPSWEFIYSTGLIQVSTDESTHFLSLYNSGGLYITGYRYIGTTGGLSSGAGTAEKIIKVFTCDSTAAEKDVVYLDPSNINKVLICNNNTNTIASFGIVEQKLTPTTCVVITNGYSNLIFDGLLKNKNIFLGTDGKITQTPPLTGYVQVLGIGFEAEKAYININLQRTNLD